MKPHPLNRRSSTTRACRSTERGTGERAASRSIRSTTADSNAESLTLAILDVLQTLGRAEATRTGIPACRLRRPRPVGGTAPCADREHYPATFPRHAARASHLDSVSADGHGRVEDPRARNAPPCAGAMRSIRVNREHSNGLRASALIAVFLPHLRSAGSGARTHMADSAGGFWIPCALPVTRGEYHLLAVPGPVRLGTSRVSFKLRCPVVALVVSWEPWIRRETR